MKGVLLAGGEGSRLRPITHTGPKQLIPVANRPVIEYAIEDFKEAGITDIAVVLGNKGREEVQEYLGDGSEFGVDITYVVQGNPLGIAHAVGCTREFVGEDDVVVYLGDNILHHGIGELVDSFTAGEFTAGIALQEVENPQQFGVADVAEDGTVREFVEKPDDPPSNLALVGIYAFSPEIFDVIESLDPSWRGEYEITHAIQRLLGSGEPIDAQTVHGWWKDTGKPEDILEANRLVLEDLEDRREGEISPEAEVSGRVELEEGAVIGEGAVVRGPVTIDSGTTVRGDTYVGPYTSIGEDCLIEGIHIENSVVVGESNLTATGKITDSLIGRGAMIGDASGLNPDGRRLVVGENSKLKL